MRASPCCGAHRRRGVPGEGYRCWAWSARCGREGALQDGGMALASARRREIQAVPVCSGCRRSASEKGLAVQGRARASEQSVRRVLGSKCMGWAKAWQREAAPYPEGGPLF